MQTQTLRNRVASKKDELTELSNKMARGQKQEPGRDSEVHEPRHVDTVNWNKGWGKYGKT